MLREGVSLARSVQRRKKGTNFKELVDVSSQKEEVTPRVPYCLYFHLPFSSPLCDALNLPRPGAGRLLRRVP